MTIDDSLGSEPLLEKLTIAPCGAPVGDGATVPLPYGPWLLPTAEPCRAEDDPEADDKDTDDATEKEDDDEDDLDDGGSIEEIPVVEDFDENDFDDDFDDDFEEDFEEEIEEELNEEIGEADSDEDDDEFE